MKAENKHVEPSSERIPLFGCCGTSTDDNNILNPTLQVSGLAKLVVAGALQLRCGVRARGDKKVGPCMPQQSTVCQLMPSREEPAKWQYTQKLLSSSFSQFLWFSHKKL